MDSNATISSVCSSWFAAVSPAVSSRPAARSETSSPAACRMVMPSTPSSAVYSSLLLSPTRPRFRYCLRSSPRSSKVDKTDSRIHFAPLSIQVERWGHCSEWPRAAQKGHITTRRRSWHSCMRFSAASTTGGGHRWFDLLLIMALKDGRLLVLPAKFLRLAVRARRCCHCALRTGDSMALTFGGGVIHCGGTIPRHLRKRRREGTGSRLSRQRRGMRG